MNFDREPLDPSAAYYVRSGAFYISEAHTPAGIVYVAAHKGQILHTGTLDECKAACASFDSEPATDTGPLTNQTTRQVAVASRRRA